MDYYIKNLLDKYDKEPTPQVYAYRNSNGDIIYIGSTKNLSKRHLKHLYDSKRSMDNIEYDSIDYYLYKHVNTDLFVIKECETRTDAYKLERELINLVKPMYNRI